MTDLESTTQGTKIALPVAHSKLIENPVWDTKVKDENTYRSNWIAFIERDDDARGGFGRVFLERRGQGKFDVTTDRILDKDVWMEFGCDIKMKDDRTPVKRSRAYAKVTDIRADVIVLNFATLNEVGYPIGKASTVSGPPRKNKRTSRKKQPIIQPPESPLKTLESFTDAELLQEVLKRNLVNVRDFKLNHDA